MAFFGPSFLTLLPLLTRLRKMYQDMPDTGKRHDGTNKGPGFLGTLPLTGGAVATEYSIGVEMDGKEVSIPTLVPTLTQKEIDLMVNSIIPNRSPVPRSIVQKAVAHARERISRDQNPFKEYWFKMGRRSEP